MARSRPDKRTRTKQDAGRGGLTFHQQHQQRERREKLLAGLRRGR